MFHRPQLMKGFLLELTGHCHIYIYLVDVKNALSVFPTFFARTFFLRFYLRFSYVFLFRFFYVFLLFFLRFLLWLADTEKLPSWDILEASRPALQKSQSFAPTFFLRFLNVFCTFFTVIMACPPLKGICLQGGRVGGGIEKDTVFSTFFCPFFLRCSLSFFLHFLFVFPTFFFRKM